MKSRTKPTEFSLIIQDIKTGALPLSEIPGFLAFLFRKLAWFSILLAIVGYFLLSGFTQYPAPPRAQPHLTRVAIVSTGYPTGYANLRACPSKTCHVSATLPDGTELQVAPGTGETWLNILSPAGQGWMYSEYVAVVEK